MTGTVGEEHMMFEANSPNRVRARDPSPCHIEMLSAARRCRHSLIIEASRASVDCLASPLP